MAFDKKLFSPLFAAAVLAIFLHGCFLAQEPYTPVHYYDLGNPPIFEMKGVDLSVNSFRMESPAKYKMVYRMENCKAFVDDYNKWVQPPPNMLSRYIQLAFSSEKTGEENPDNLSLSLEASVISFDIDLETKTVTLGVDYKIACAAKNVSVSKSRVFRKNFEGADPSDFASAMSDAALQFAKELKHDIIFLQKKCAEAPKEANEKTPTAKGSEKPRQQP